MLISILASSLLPPEALTLFSSSVQELAGITRLLVWLSMYYIILNTICVNDKFI